MTKIYKPKLLFVGQTNKSRSPALAAYTQKYLQKKGIEVKVESAGICEHTIKQLRNKNQDRISNNTEIILKHNNINSENHYAKYIGEVIKGSKLILTTEEEVLQNLREHFPKYSKRSGLAKEYAFPNNPEHLHDILGPYHPIRGQGTNPGWTKKQGYENMLQEINKISEAIANRFYKEFK